MSWKDNLIKIEPYVAGEQPNKTDFIKLNANENPYPPAPGVIRAIEQFRGGSLKKYPDANAKPLADALAKLLSLEAYCTLEKVKDTARQAELDFEERSKNLKGAFKVTDKKFVKGKRVLVVDDVLTTGATSHEVASALKTAGVKSVYLLTVASVSREKKAKKEENEEENEEIR